MRSDLRGPQPTTAGDGEHGEQQDEDGAEDGERERERESEKEREREREKERERTRGERERRPHRGAIGREGDKAISAAGSQNSHLEPYPLPRRILVVAAVHRTPSIPGQVFRPALRERLP